jgi:hypothetical protein
MTGRETVVGLTDDMSLIQALALFSGVPPSKSKEGGAAIAGSAAM